MIVVVDSLPVKASWAAASALGAGTCGRTSTAPSTSVLPLLPPLGGAGVGGGPEWGPRVVVGAAVVVGAVVVVVMSLHGGATVTVVNRVSPAEPYSPFGPHGATDVTRTVSVWPTACGTANCVVIE